MKHKFKPLAKSEIREGVERKFRARGALVFHLLLAVFAAVVVLYNLPAYWYYAFRDISFRDSLLAFALLSATGALHYTFYTFRHGRGRDKHEAEIEMRIADQLRHATADEFEEQEELIRLQMRDKVKNRRLVWQHLVIFAGIMSMAAITTYSNMRPSLLVNWEYWWERWRDFLTAAGIWGTGLAAHFLRYYFTYGFSAGARQAKIDAAVARELRNQAADDRERDGDSRAKRLNDGAARAERMTIEEIEAGQQQARR